MIFSMETYALSYMCNGIFNLNNTN